MVDANIVPRCRSDNPAIQSCDLAEHIEIYLQELKDRSAKNPKKYSAMMQLLDDYVQTTGSNNIIAPKDIVIVLYGALSHMHVLAPFVAGNSRLYYRTNFSYTRGKEDEFIIGELHPDHNVLIFDDDLISGRHLYMTRAFLVNYGYSTNKIHAFISNGYSQNYGEPILGMYKDIIKLGTDEDFASGNIKSPC